MSTEGMGDHYAEFRLDISNLQLYCGLYSHAPIPPLLQLKLILPVVQDALVETRMNIKGHAAHYILGLYFRFQPPSPFLYQCLNS